MLNPIAPNTTPSDMEGVFTILRLLSDENAYKKRFTDLEKLAADSGAKEASAQRREKEVAANIEKSIAQANEIIQRAQEFEKQVNDRHNANAAKQHQLDRDTAALAANRASLESEFKQRNAAFEQEMADRKSEHAAQVEEFAASVRNFNNQRDQRMQELSRQESALKERELAVNDGSERNKDTSRIVDEMKRSLQVKLDKFKAIREITVD